MVWMRLQAHVIARLVAACHIPVRLVASACASIIWDEHQGVLHVLHPLCIDSCCSVFARVAFFVYVLLYTRRTKESGNNKYTGTSVVAKSDSLVNQPYIATSSPSSSLYRLTMNWKSQPSRVGPVLSAVGHLATLCGDKEKLKSFRHILIERVVLSV